jgi:hypothetical protein
MSSSRACPTATDLRELAIWVDMFARRGGMTADGHLTLAAALRGHAEECERLEQALAVARRWARAHDFAALFARHVAIREGVRAGRVIDLVPILEREMAQNAARRGGAA